MNKVSHRSAPKAEPKAHAMSVERASQIGATVSFRKPPLQEGKGYEPPYGITDPVKAVGVGGGREIHKSGSQGQHGTPDRGMPGLPSTKGQWPD
jgi:hypothetical protein